MIERMATGIVNQMGEARLISKSMEEHYIYTLIMMLERWVAVGTIMTIGLICKKFIPTLFFLGFFLSLRERTGGYHANTFCHCYFCTVLTYLVILKASLVLEENVIFMYGLVLVSFLVIINFGTVNHPNIHMNADELKKSKSIARWLVLLECMVIAVMSVLGIFKTCVSYMSVAIILCAALIMVAKIKKQEVSCIGNSKEVKHDSFTTSSTCD